MVPVERVAGRGVAVPWPPGRATGVSRVDAVGDVPSRGPSGSGRQEEVTGWVW